MTGRCQGLERGSNDVACHGDSNFSPAVETPTITEKDEYAVSESVPSFVLEFSDSLLRAAKNGDRLTASQLGKLLTDTSFDLRALRRYLKSLAYFKDDINRRTWKLMKDDGFCSVHVRGYIGKKDGCCTPYMKNVTGVFRE